MNGGRTYTATSHSTTAQNFWLFNGITNYFQNVKIYTTKGEYDAEKKFDNIINGGTAHAKIMRAYTDILMAAYDRHSNTPRPR